MSYVIRILADEKKFSPATALKAVMKAACARCLAAEGVAGAQVNIFVCSDALITTFNRRYLRHQGPTDVISFTISDPASNVLQAEIIISSETAASNARTYGTTPADELCLYAVHGVLHAIGYDDNTPRKRKVMERKAWQYLKRRP